MRLIPVALIVASAAAAYTSAFDGVALFDDRVHLKPYGSVIEGLAHNPHRPLLGMSLALNYRISGDNLWSHHLLSVSAHAINALLLYGIILSLSGRRWRATACACVFAAHWLGADCVTYITQRGETLAATGILGAVFCFSRQQVTGRKWWLVPCVAFAAFGAGFKPVAFVTPFIILFIHHKRHGGGLNRAYHQMPTFACAVSIPAAWLAFMQRYRIGHHDGNSAGFNVHPLLDWWATQCRAVCWYVERAIVPQVVPIDPGFGVTSAWENWPYILAVAALVIAAAILLDRRSWAGVLAMSALAILAVTSSVPIRDAAWSYRAYLPNVAVIVGACWAVGWLISEARPAFKWATVAVIVACCASVTARHNSNYQDPLTMWRAVTAYAPHHWRGWYNRALHAKRRKRYHESVRCYYEALRAKPGVKAAHRGLAKALMQKRPMDIDRGVYHIRVSKKMDKWG